jgi:hypothetical protein
MTVIRAMKSFLPAVLLNFPVRVQVLTGLRCPNSCRRRRFSWRGAFAALAPEVVAWQHDHERYPPF